MTESDENRRRVAKVAATVAIGFFAYFLLALLFLHGLRPDYTIVDHMISDYAVGRWGWIMTTAFCAASAGCLALAIGMFLGGPTAFIARLGTLLILVASAGLLVTAMYPTDLETAPSTPTGDVHAISFLVNIASLFVSSVLLATSYGRNEVWSARQRPAFAIVICLLVAFAGQYFTLHRGAPYGLTNRLFVLVLMGWLLSNAVWLRSASTAKGKRWNDLFLEEPRVSDDFMVEREQPPLEARESF